MKLQDVILKAMAKKISWMDAAEIVGVTDRTMRRIRERYQEFGYTGLFDQRRGKRSIHRIPMQTAEEVLRLYREVYFDLNMRHFHEKLRDEHGINLSYTWVQQALQGAGLVAKRHKRGPHRRRRPRRPMAGMLLHIDGSKHQWLNDDRWHDLIVILDDATSEIYYAQLVEEESTRTVMAGLREVIESKGLFCALYSDRGSHFFVTTKEGEKVDKHRLTQVGRSMKELGVQMIAAYSPQARGRSERSFGTWQGRLPQELRLAGITTVEGANTFLRERYIREFNEKFRVAAEEKGTAFRRTSVTAGAETAPEARHFVNRQGRHNAFGNLHTQTRQRWPGAAIAECRLPPVELLKAGRRRRHDVGELAVQSTFSNPDAGVNRIGSRTGLLADLVTHVVQQGGTGERLLGYFISGMAIGPPTHELQQGESITTQGVPGQAADTALIQKAVDPDHLAAGGLSDHPKRALRAAEVHPVDQLVSHERALSSNA